MELCCPQYKSLHPDCQPHNFTFFHAGQIFVEKYALSPKALRWNSAIYTKSRVSFSLFRRRENAPHAARQSKAAYFLISFFAALFFRDFGS